MRRFRLPCSVAMLLALATTARATTLYVSMNGNDASVGTIDAPLATPDRALQLAAPGDTVLLRGGVYTITRSLQITQAGLTFASYPEEWAHIVAGTTDLTNLTSVILVYAGGVTVRDIEIQGASYYGIKLDDLYGPQSGIRLADLYIHHTGRDGIKTQNSDGLVIERCEIGFTGVRDATNAEGIDVMGSIGAAIRNNYVHDTATNGIYVKAGTRQAVVEANRVERTGYSGILLGSESAAQYMRDGAVQEAIDSVARNNIVIDASLTGLGSVSGDNVRFENNTVVNAARTGQAAFRVVPNEYNTPAHNVLLINNIFVLDPSSTRPMVHLLNYTDPITSDHNVWYSAAGIYQYWREFSTGGSSYWTSLGQWRLAMNADWNSQAIDPALNSADLYRPLPGSAAIDAGETLLEVPIDYAGTARPQGAAYDIGAYEGASTMPAPTVPSAPTSLVASVASRTSVALAWTDTSSNEQGFHVERAMNGGAFTVLATLPANTQTYTDTTVKRNKTYTYRIAAFNTAGASAYSNSTTLTVR